MDKKTEYQIAPHERGWAVVIDNVIKAVYPSQYLAATSIHARENYFVLVDEIFCKRGVAHAVATDVAVRGRHRNQLHLAAGLRDRIGIPLKRQSGEISSPVSLDAQRHL